MALDLPSSPTTGQIFSSAGAMWKWDGSKWASYTTALSITMADAPPSTPAAGQGWWDSTSGQLYLYYSDPNSSQWVPAFNIPAGAATTPFLSIAGGTMTGKLVINQNSATPVVAATGQLHLVSADSGPGSSAVFDFFGSGWASLTLRRTNGTAGAPTSPLVNDVLGSVEGHGYVSGSYWFGTGIYSIAKENWTGSARGTFLQFNTVNGTATEASVIIARGLVVGGTFGNDLGPGTIYANSTIRSGAGIFATGNMIISNSVAGPTGQTSEFDFQNIGCSWAIGGASNPFHWFIYSNTTGNIGYRMQVQLAGACYNVTGTWNAFSDASLKTDIADYHSGLEQITKLRPVSFGWKDKGFGPEKNWGLVAQEVEAIMPELVSEVNIAHPNSGTPNMVKAVDPGRLIYAVINSVKELNSRIVELEAEIASLKAQ